MGKVTYAAFLHHPSRKTRISLSVSKIVVPLQSTLDQFSPEKTSLEISYYSQRKKKMLCGFKLIQFLGLTSPCKVERTPCFLAVGSSLLGWGNVGGTAAHTGPSQEEQVTHSWRLVEGLPREHVFPKPFTHLPSGNILWIFCSQSLLLEKWKWSPSVVSNSLRPHGL